MKKYLNGDLVDMTAEEISARNTEITEWNNGAFERELNELRKIRNNLLSKTDYIVTMNLEAGTDIPAEWKTYRQSLRDLTNGLTTVEQVKAVVYPTKPE